MKQHIISVIKLLGIGIFSFLFFVVILFVLQGKDEYGRGPTLFGWSSYTILSNSMQPSFSSGDVVVMKPVEDIEVTVDDIITFMMPERRFVTHRVTDQYVEEGVTYYVTKGDNNNVTDEDPVVKEQIVGVHVFTIPKLGSLAQSIRQPIGYVLLIALPLAIYLLLTLYEIIRKRSNEKS
ncbi:signal peptidase I [Bacillus sp. FSL W7-1360]